VLEREIKLQFSSAEEARRAIAAAGATSLRARRLQDDVLLDTDDQVLGQRGRVLRIRRERSSVRLQPDLVVVTLKGPVQPGTMKTREEHETIVGDDDVIARVFEALGLHVWFRYQKYREEFAAGDATIALDETPVGTFVEIEGSEQAILSVAQTLGRAPADFIRDSYRSLFLKRRAQFGLSGTHMVFAGE
jgi:adenylate cyclase class 2